MGSFWSFLAKPKNQKTLSWLGGGAVIVIAGLWGAFAYFSHRRASRRLREM
jgi:hypothetical protein